MNTREKYTYMYTSGCQNNQLKNYRTYNSSLTITTT